MHGPEERMKNSDRFISNLIGFIHRQEAA
jgi:hypothetical protein